MDKGKINIKFSVDLPGHYNLALAIVSFLYKSRAHVPRYDSKECLKYNGDHWNWIINVYLYVCMVLKTLWPKSWKHPRPIPNLAKVVSMLCNAGICLSIYKLQKIESHEINRILCHHFVSLLGTLDLVFWWTIIWFSNLEFETILSISSLCERIRLTSFPL